MPHAGTHEPSIGAGAFNGQNCVIDESAGRDEYYLRIAPFFKTSASQYAWIDQIVAVGLDERVGPNVAYDLFEIL